MTGNSAPAVDADSFPTPPRTVEDAEGRAIALRAAAPDERDEALAMYEAFDPADRAQGVPPSKPDQIEDWLDLLLEEGVNVYAWHDGDVVGHAVLVPDDDGGWELAIFVHQPYQGAGIGTELLRTLLGYGRTDGVERVWLTVERWNHPAIALYESVGFEPTDAERFEMGMELQLADSAD